MDIEKLSELRKAHPDATMQVKDQNWVKTHRVEKCEPYYDEESNEIRVFKLTELADDEDKDKHEFELGAKIRKRRNELIAETDWRFRSDMDTPQEWVDYCQALRDITSQETFPHSVKWPVPPR